MRRDDSPSEIGVRSLRCVAKLPGWDTRGEVPAQRMARASNLDDNVLERLTPAEKPKAKKTFQASLSRTIGLPVSTQRELRHSLSQFSIPYPI